MQVAINILENAISNTFNGYIKLTAKYNFHKQRLFLTCEDTGTGIEI